MLNKNVIGIDFGGSFTKIAYRNAFTDGRVSQFEARTSKPITISGSNLIPTLAIETGRSRRPWVFGAHAASIKPAPGMNVHKDWKSGLILSDGEPIRKEPLRVAHAFFSWLLESLKNPNVIPFDPMEAAVVLTIPALQCSGESLERLTQAVRKAGWINEILIKTSEPRANTIGFCTSGRNIRTIYDTPNWGDMFSMSHPFIQFTRNTQSRSTATLAILDIGSFTSDLSLIDWHPNRTEGYLDGGFQESYRHGIVDQMDALCLPSILEDAVETIDKLELNELEALKHSLYSGATYELSGFTLGTAKHQKLISSTIEHFCDSLWRLIQPVLRSYPIKWFLLTGGGAAIPQVREILGAHFRELGDGKIQTSELDGLPRRSDTAIGATSMIVFTSRSTSDKPLRDLPLWPPNRSRPSNQNCSCHGLNPQCSKCGGRG